jgi:hypothetical protein
MKDLDSYLNDHLAGSVGAVELINHWIEVCEGKQLGEFFTAIKNDISSDQQILRDLMRALGAEESSVRRAGAWAVEKLSRAKFAIAGDEIGGLGLLLALETLVIGITGKKLLWRALAAADLPQLQEIDFAKLTRRAEQQIDRVEAERIRAAQQALSIR